MALTIPQQAELKTQLDYLAEQIQARLQAHSPRETAVHSTIGDDGVAEAMADNTLAQYLHEDQEWQAVQLAQARLAAGEVDVCNDCAVTIPYVRLHAEPTATRCIHCQSTVEAQQKRLHLPAAPAFKSY